MKRAVVVGGSNGIGLAISLQLLKRGYYVIIVSRSEPDKKFFSNFKNYAFYQTDLLQFDKTIFFKLANDSNIKMLVITAGFGKIAEFKYLNESEIENTIYVNLIATINIIKVFYNKIRSKDKFYCGIMGSINGFINSPLFSVYGASKAGLRNFIESVNVELEEDGIDNRILNISPGRFKGSRFYGAANSEPKQLETMANDIIDRLEKSHTLFIPNYEKIYKGVIERYNKDPHMFGLDSYQYKIDFGRVKDKN